jgi:predicted homoserine dehydrogenase-like protein
MRAARKVKVMAMPTPSEAEPESPDGILTDEEVARRVENGELVTLDEVPFDEKSATLREEVLKQLRENVKNWRKPPLKQDRPPT